MKEYIMTLVGTALVITVVSMLAPDGKLGKYVQLVGAICILCVCVSPVVSFVSKISSADGAGFELEDEIFGDYIDEDEKGEGIVAKYSGIYQDSLLEKGGANMSEGLKSMLCRDMGLKYDEIEVYVKLCEGEEKYIPENVSIVLCDSAVFADPHEITEYVSSLLGCRCDIIYG